MPLTEGRKLNELYIFDRKTTIKYIRNMVEKVFKFIKENRIFDSGDSVILGVSGGADSICMLTVLCKLKHRLNLKLYVVHVNHGIRGGDALEDENFVKEFCEKENLSFFPYHINVPEIVKKTGMSEEEAGRRERYRIFYELANELKADKIAVAHNLNDNSETILFNMFRGTGIKGMTGIPVQRDKIVRPLLCVTRAEIEAYLDSLNISYCMDITNKSTEYTRNKIRLELLPYIKENINKKAEYNIVNAAEKLSEINDYMEQQVDAEYKKYVKGNLILNEGEFLHPAVKNQVIRRVIENQAGCLKDIMDVHVRDVATLFKGQVSKKINLPYNLIAVKEYDGVIIKKAENKQQYFKEKVLIDKGRIFKDDTVEIVSENNGFNRENIKELVYTKWLDYDKIDKLILRTRAKGDYIVIDDNGRKKKLKEYFINEKIKKEDRDTMPLLADGNHIVWIPGYRISAYYKVTPETKNIIRINYKNKE